MEVKVNNKKIIVITLLLIIFIGVTLAYVISQISDGAIGKANVTADTTDNLQFSVDKDISLNPTQFNVPEGGGGLSDTAVGTATLLANSTNNSATFGYYVYFKINTNEYIYTTEEQKPEIVLTIIDPTGQPVTSVDSLTYVTAENADGTTVSGFDITTQSGLFNIASNYEITSSSSKEATEQDWIFTVTFINLTTNQSENGGSTLDAEIILSKDERYTLANYIINKVYVEDGVNGLYYHDGQGTYANAELEAGDYSYRYAGGDYKIADEYKGTYNNLNEIVVLVDGYLYNNTLYTSDLDIFSAVALEYCKVATCNSEDVIDAIINGTNNDLMYDFYEYYNNLTNNGKILIDGIYQLTYDSTNYYIGYNDALNQAFKDGYVLSEVIDNYVCFGSAEETCPNDNLYRIIGIFDDDVDGLYNVKLVKYDYATSNQLGSNGDYAGYIYNDYFGNSNNYRGNIDTASLMTYRWNYDTSVSQYGSNNWATSEFNKINLNTNYWNYLGTTWQNLIAETTWHLGGMTSNDNTAKEFYDGERNNAGYGSNPTTYSDEIGLMYPSDYGYAASPDAWATNISSYDNIILNNWLYMGLSEFIITPRASLAYQVFDVNDDGTLNTHSARLGFAIRPTFYLNSNVELAGGTGTSTDPYRIVD